MALWVEQLELGLFVEYIEAQALVGLDFLLLLLASLELARLMASLGLE